MSEEQEKRNGIEADEPKRKRGHPPWTEEQKAARKALNDKKRAEREIEKRRAETYYAAKKRRAKGKKYREGLGGAWSAEMRASNKATWDAKLKERDDNYLQLIKDNPHKTKRELGIPDSWKPRDGSPTGYYGVKLRQARVGISLPPINIKNPHEVETRIDEYFDFCEMNDRLPNMVELSNWLGVGRETLQKWKDGIHGSAEHEQIICRALSVIEASLVAQVQAEPKIMVGGMFLLKSMFHYREQSDVNFNVTTNAERELSADEIAKRYLGDGKTVETEFVEEKNDELQEM